jgi:chromosome partitioning protein
MPVSVSLINMKGGVGKTTLAFNLAWFAAHARNKKVLVVDLDPQANASQYLMGVKKYLAHIKANKPTVVSILEQFTPAFHGTTAPTPLNPAETIYAVREWGDGSLIHLIPSRLELAWTLKNPTSKDHLLANFLANHGQSYDFNNHRLRSYRVNFDSCSV